MIFGKTVVLKEGATVFDDSDPSFNFNTVAIDDVLEVSGHVDAAGAIHTTWVRRLGVLSLGTTAVELEGIVSGFTGLGWPSFMLGPVIVYTDASTDFLGLNGSVVNGRSVEAEGILVAPGIVQASRVADVDKLPFNKADFSLEGIVSDFVSLADFRVAGQQVDATGATFVPPNPGFVADGVVVEVQGPISAGVLGADEVELESEEVKIEAELASTADVDPVTGRVVLLGIEVELAPGAQLQDERDLLPGFGLGDIVEGDFLRIQGVKQVSGAILADQLDRTVAGDILLQGPATGFDELVPEVEICGFTVPLSSGSEFSDPLGAPLSLSEFFQGLQIGAAVKVLDWMDADDTAIDVADEAQLE